MTSNEFQNAKNVSKYKDIQMKKQKHFCDILTLNFGKRFPRKVSVYQEFVPLIAFLFAILFLLFSFRSSTPCSSCSSDPITHQVLQAVELDKLLLPYHDHRQIPSNFVQDISNYSNYLILDSFQKKLIQIFFLDYMKYHSKERYSKNSRLLIFRPCNTGFGDRFERLMMAFYMSVVSNRVFLIDWKRPFPIEDFVSTAFEGTDLFLREQSDYDNYGKTKRSELIIDKEKHDREFYLTTLQSKQRYVVSTMKYRPNKLSLEYLGREAFGHFSEHSNWIHFIGSVYCRRLVLNYVLRLNNKFNEEFKRTAKGIDLLNKPRYSVLQPNLPKETNYVSVHARLGRGVGETEDPRFNPMIHSLHVPLNCLAIRAVRTAFKMSYPPPNIYFATDTPSVRSTFINIVRELSGGKINVVHGNWDAFHSNHIDQGRGLRDPRVHGTENKWKAMLGIYLDLVMIGNARHIIALRSQFPKLAFSLGTAETVTELGLQHCLSQIK